MRRLFLGLLGALVLGSTACSGQVKTGSWDDAGRNQGSIRWSVVKSPSGRCYEVAERAPGSNAGLMGMGSEIPCPQVTY